MEWLSASLPHPLADPAQRASLCLLLPQAGWRKEQAVGTTTTGWIRRTTPDELVWAPGDGCFALLVLDPDPMRALDAAVRMRDQLPRGSQCAIGIAVRRGAETLDELAARAGDALSRAQSARGSAVYYAV